MYKRQGHEISEKQNQLRYQDIFLQNRKQKFFTVIFSFILHYITLHYIKSYLECPKSLRTARTLYEIKGVMWEYSYVGKHLEKR